MYCSVMRMLRELSQADGKSCQMRLQGGSPSPAGAHVVIVDDIIRTGKANTRLFVDVVA